MMVGSWKDGLYDISQNTSHEDGMIEWTHMFQQVTEESGPSFNKHFRGTCFDFLQSILGTRENPHVLCVDDGLSTLARPVFKMNGAFGPDSGWYSSLDLVGKNGEKITKAWYVRRENE